jgi:hypothetical protein
MRQTESYRHEEVVADIDVDGGTEERHVKFAA